MEINNFTKKNKSGLQYTLRAVKNSLDRLGIRIFGKDIDYYNNLTNVKSCTKMSSGENGVVYLLTYNNDAQKILKVAKNTLGDNPVYEYFVGKHFINKHLNTGTFVKTYGLFIINPPEVKEVPQDNTDPEHQYAQPFLPTIEEAVPEDIGLDFLKTRLELVNNVTVEETEERYKEIINGSCAKENDRKQTFAFLIDYVPGISFIDFCKSESASESSIVKILIKIYKTLNQLYPNFIHRDLNINNIIIRSTFLGRTPIIIDYGRSYFDSGIKNSLEIYNILKEKYSIEEIKDNGYINIFSLENDIFMNQSVTCTTPPPHFLASNRLGMATALEALPPPATAPLPAACTDCRNSMDLQLLDDLKSFIEDPPIKPQLVTPGTQTEFPSENDLTKNNQQIAHPIGEINHKFESLLALLKRVDTKLDKDFCKKETVATDKDINTIQRALIELRKLRFFGGKAKTKKRRNKRMSWRASRRRFR